MRIWTAKIGSELTTESFAATTVWDILAAKYGRVLGIGVRKCKYAPKRRYALSGPQSQTLWNIGLEQTTTGS